MKHNNQKKEKKLEINSTADNNLTLDLWEKSWTYVRTVVDIVREPILILDKNFKVMAANDSFYRTFQVEMKDTEGKKIYELGNHQWDIPALRKLLEDILPKNTFFKGFEVSHEFPFIGRKVMILNAREIHFKEDKTSVKFPPIILLAIEDITDMVAVAETLAEHANSVQLKFIAETKKLKINVKKLEKEILDMKNNS
ncbi:MAG: PAS domain-containing protein [Candidatus Paceibacterota bacterium]